MLARAMLVMVWMACTATPVVSANATEMQGLTKVCAMLAKLSRAKNAIIRAVLLDGDSNIAAVLCGEGVGDIQEIEHVKDIIAKIDQNAREIIAAMPNLLQ